MATPYRTDAQIEKAYNDLYRSYQATQQAQADRQKAQKDTEYDDTQRQGYVNYMNTKKDMPGYLANLGVLGGGSETTALRADTNYQNAHQGVEKRRNADRTAIDNTLKDTLNQYKMVADENMRKEMQQENQLRIAYAREQERLAEERFAKTISGYGTLNSIDAEIAAIKQRNIPGEWSMKYPYLMARRNELLQAQAVASASIGSSSGGTSKSIGGGGGSTTTTSTPAMTKAQAVGEVQSILGVNPTATAVKKALSSIASGGSKSKSYPIKYYSKRY